MKEVLLRDIDLNASAYDRFRYASGKKLEELILEEMESLGNEVINIYGSDQNYEEWKNADNKENDLDFIEKNIEDFMENNFCSEEVQNQFDFDYVKEYLSEEVEYPLTFNGEYKWVSRYSTGYGKTTKFNFTFNDDKEFLEFLTTERARGSVAILEDNKLIVPMEDLGGGIITDMKLKLVEGDK